MSVGMLITSKRRVTLGLSSTLSFATLTLPACSDAISSRIGEIILQGPHQSAQKSTTTASVAAPISSSNVESVRVLMPSAISVGFLLVLFNRTLTAAPTLGSCQAFLRQLVMLLVVLEPTFGIDRGH